MFDAGNYSSKVRRLLKATMPSTLPQYFGSSLAPRRLSPLLLLAAALIALAVFFAPGARPAAAGQEQAQINSITTTNYAYHTDPWPECDTVPIDGCMIGYKYFGIGDEVLLAAEYSAPVTVTGTPIITLDVGGAEKLATFKEVQGSRLIFGYTVREGDEDHDGLSIPAGSIDLAGGTINGEGGAAASLSHNGLTNQDWHRIDGVRPTFLGIRKPSGAATVMTAFTASVMK